MGAGLRRHDEFFCLANHHQCNVISAQAGIYASFHKLDESVDDDVLSPLTSPRWEEVGRKS